MTRSNLPNETRSKQPRELRNVSLRLGPTSITDSESQQWNISPWPQPLSWLWQVRPHHGRDQHIAIAKRLGPHPIAMLELPITVKLPESEKPALVHVTNEKNTYKNAQITKEGIVSSECWRRRCQTETTPPCDFDRPENRANSQPARRPDPTWLTKLVSSIPVSRCGFRCGWNQRTSQTTKENTGNRTLD